MLRTSFYLLALAALLWFPLSATAQKAEEASTTIDSSGVMATFSDVPDSIVVGSPSEQALADELAKVQIKREFAEISVKPKYDETQINMDHGVPLSKSPTKAFVLSLLVPGLGQVYTHNYFKAILFLGTDIGMYAGIMTQDRLSRENLKYAEIEAQDELRASYAEWHQYLHSFYKSDRNKLIWWTAGVTLLAATDAYVEAHLYDFHIDPTLGVTPEGDGVTAGVSITF